MSSVIPVTGAPANYALGVDDKSVKTPLYESAPRAIHTPHIYTWCEWGPTQGQLVYGNTFELMYGNETLNPRGKFANHVTEYVRLFLSNANPMFVERLLPKDIGPKASLRIYMDVVEEEFEELSRNIDGSFERDVNGDLVPTGNKVQGYLVKFIKEAVPNDPVMGSNFGKGTIKTGTMQNTAGVNSKMYPVFDFVAPHYGAKGNNYGFRIWPATRQDSNPMKEALLDKDGYFPYRVSMIERKDEYSATKIVKTMYGEYTDDFVLRPDTVDKDYNKSRGMKDIVVEGYQELNPFIGSPLRFGPLGDLKVYNDNIEYLSRLFLTAESASNYMGSDLIGTTNTPDSEDYYKVNFLGFQHSNGAPYQAVRFNRTSSDGVRFTEITDFFLMGASDGTVTDAELASLVSDRLDAFGDPDSDYQDIILCPSSMFWDTGFPLEVKFKLGKYVSHRKNTVVVGSTYIANEPILSASEESSRHIAIVERMRAYAESDYFATPTFRACVVASSGRPLMSSYKKRVSCSYELANMVSRLAAGRSFKKAMLFDRYPRNTFELLGDVSCLTKPMTARHRDWIMGMMWPERLDERRVYFPATRTIHKNDTSVLISFIGAIIIAEIQTVAAYAQKRFSGGHFSKSELKFKIEDYCTQELSQRFADLVKIEPICHFTDFDDNRGWSWSLKIKVFIPMMRTVQRVVVESYNMDDIPASSAAFIS